MSDENDLRENGLVPAEADEQAVVLARGFGEVVEAGYHALEQAETDFERLMVRDKAAAVAAAAKALEPSADDRGGLRAVQVKAAGLVATAERAVARANPERQGRRTDLELRTPMSEVPQKQLQRIRRAHEGITDRQFEDLKRQADEHGEPLTRAGLRRFSEPEPPPAPELPPDMLGGLPKHGFEVSFPEQTLTVEARSLSEARRLAKERAVRAVADGTVKPTARETTPA